MEREFIVLCGEHYNPLGIIRSLGEAGIKPIAIVKKNEFQLTSKSKYIKKLHFVNSIEEGFNLLLETLQMKNARLMYIQLTIRR